MRFGVHLDKQRQNWNIVTPMGQIVDIVPARLGSDDADAQRRAARYRAAAFTLANAVAEGTVKIVTDDPTAIEAIAYLRSRGSV